MGQQMSGKFWEHEEPEVFVTKKNVFRYYKGAGKLVVHLPDYIHAESGQPHMGKGVGIDLKALADKPDVVEQLRRIM